MQTKITIEELAQLIRETREAQKAFFRNRNKVNLKAAMKIEEKLDNILKQIEEPKKGFWDNLSQQNLFTR